MNIPIQKFKEKVISEDFITEADFDILSAEANRMGHSIADVLVSRGIISQKYLDDLLVSHLGTERADFASIQIDKNILQLLSEDLAKEKRAIVFAKDDDGVFSVAMEDPSNLATIEFLEQSLGGSIKPFLALGEDLNKGFALYGKKLSKDFQQIIEENIKASLHTGKKDEEAATEVPIVAIVDNIISYAFSVHSSDIHFEIFDDEILIRYRIDGVLQEIAKIPKQVHAAIVARVKLLSQLKIDEHYKPQDGRFRYQIVGSDNVLDIRVSVLPTYYGEKVEMRLLTASQRPLSLKELGMLEDTVELVKESIKKSYGMVLICGPTGSGKTTTLYSILNILNKPQVNIVTIEDPIEYDVKFINQTQINPVAGITFANGLRSILRQDPNIIMVGEVRDRETADISIQAALTGHLVLSSLHTNDAPTTVPRLVDMGVAPFLVAAVVNIVLAQRLVRSICLNCIYSMKPTKEMIDIVEDQLKELGVQERTKMPKLVYEGKGCVACGGDGYKGRIGIFEALDITKEARKVIISKDFSLANLKTVAKDQGMKSMFEDGLRKVEKGMTTLEEVLRVIRE
ncbi:GspE/PulE family protein [Patescibacteria group bacterium]|nr:GspE/PulE family protein [Patescibacteria group bacterium]